MSHSWAKDTDQGATSQEETDSVEWTIPRSPRSRSDSDSGESRELGSGEEDGRFVDGNCAGLLTLEDFGVSDVLKKFVEIDQATFEDLLPALRMDLASELDNVEALKRRYTQHALKEQLARSREFASPRLRPGCVRQVVELMRKQHWD